MGSAACVYAGARRTKKRIAVGARQTYRIRYNGKGKKCLKAPAVPADLKGASQEKRQAEKRHENLATKKQQATTQIF